MNNITHFACFQVYSEKAQAMVGFMLDNEQMLRIVELLETIESERSGSAIIQKKPNPLKLLVGGL